MSEGQNISKLEQRRRMIARNEKKKCHICRGKKRHWDSPLCYHCLMATRRTEQMIGGWRNMYVAMLNQCKMLQKGHRRKNKLIARLRREINEMQAD